MAPSDPAGAPTNEEVIGIGKLKKPLIWLVVAFFAYAIVKSPDQAADIVHSAWNGLLDGLQAIGHFFDALLSSS
ncbi:hypothetical protein [Angustibacter luteus]|uniref:Uncharacterized protein n=1 Tax=Angustibacter luteus TaxID=658456 RepID=A0ABW1JD90_9ACTN